MPKLSVIIPVYNQPEILKRCLDALEGPLTDIKHDIILVDNNSSPGTSIFLKSLVDKKIKLISNKKNLGFAGAVNQGIRDSRADVFFILNQDAFYKDGNIKLVFDILNKDKVAGIGCKIVNKDNSIQPSCGNFPTLFNLIFDRLLGKIGIKTIWGYLIRNIYYYNSRQHPDWVSGTALFIPRYAALDIGFLSEDYFMYTEDMEWCYRARKLGYGIAYEPGLTFTHLDNGTSPERRRKKFLLMNEGLQRFFRNNYPPTKAKLFNVISYLYVRTRK